MTVTAEHDAVRAGHALAHGAEHGRILGRRGVADGVRQVDRGRAFRDRRLHHAAQEVEVGAARVLGRELHVVGEVAGAAHGRARHLQAVLTPDLELVGEMDVRRRNEHVNPAAGCRPQRFPGEIDVPLDAAGQRREHGATHLGRDPLHSPVVALRRGRETCFDHIYAERVQLPRELELLFGGQGVARSLFPVPQRSVEDDDVSDHVCSPVFPRAMALRADEKRKRRESLGTRGVVRGTACFSDPTFGV